MSVYQSLLFFPVFFFFSHYVLKHQLDWELSKTWKILTERGNGFDMKALEKKAAPVDVRKLDGDSGFLLILRRDCLEKEEGHMDLQRVADMRTP